MNIELQKDVLKRKVGKDNDIEGNLDSTLTLPEQLTQFREKGLIEPDESDFKTLKMQHDQWMKEQIDKYNEEIKPNDKIEKYFLPIKEAIEQMSMGLCNLIFVKGRGGIGKTWNIEAYLNHYFKGEVVNVTDISEAYLYRIFYENNGKVFHFRDTDKLLRSERSLLTLKTACESKPERLLTNFNYNSKNNDLPKQFLFNGKLIFDYNQITNLNNRESFEALISRGEFIHLNLSFDDICNVMRQIALTSEEKEITEWLIENYKFIGWNQFNLRNQYKAFMWYRYAKETKKDWKEYIKNKLQNQKTEIQTMLYTLIGNQAITTTELKKWLIRAQVVNTLKTAERRIREWLELGEIFKVSGDDRNFMVSLNNELKIDNFQIKVDNRQD